MSGAEIKIIAYGLLALGGVIKDYLNDRKRRKELEVFSITPKEEKPNDALRFTILGSSGSGKTTILASMYHEIEALKPGIFYPADGDIAMFDRLQEAYNNLQNEAAQEIFQTLPTQEEYEYTFNLFGNSQTPVKFYDYPGGWLASQSEERPRVIEMLRKSAGILVLIDTPYLIEENGLYKRHAYIGEIAQCIKNALENNEQDRLIIIIPMKCEKYTQNPGKAVKFRFDITEACQKIIGLKENPLYKDHISIALMPVWTMGNFIFDEFIITNNNPVPVSVYKRIDGKPFSPADVDQPLRFMLSFLLNQLVKIKQSEKNRRYFAKFLDFFIEDKNLRNLRESAAFIRKGMRADDPKFRIYSNKNFITGE